MVRLYRGYSMTHRTSPVCLHCKHRTMEYSKRLKARVLGCDAGKCEFEEKDDERKSNNRVRADVHDAV